MSVTFLPYVDIYEALNKRYNTLEAWSIGPETFFFVHRTTFLYTKV